MNNVRTIYLDWYNGSVRATGGSQLAYQYDHLSNLVIFENAPKLDNYYLIVEMKETADGAVRIFEPIQLAGSFWLVPNSYTQLAQNISFQVCCKTENGDFERHSAQFTGTILPSKDHAGAELDVDPSIMFEPYKKWVQEKGIEIVDGYVEESVQKWLDDHPEATSVPDGSLTELKFADALKLKTIKDYVTPEMYGAVGDGTTDDTNAIQSMFNAAKSGEKIWFSGSYYFSRVTIEKNGLNITGGSINGIFVLNANDLIFNSCTFGKELEIQWARGCIISKCLFNGEVGIYVPATKTVTEHVNPNTYGDPWFHAVARLSVTHCTFDVGTSSVQAYFDNTQQYGWMRCNDWIFSNNICRGVNAPSAEHDFYAQGIDGLRICENTFFTADSAANYQCPIVEIGRCDWLQIIGNNFFPATKEFIKLIDSKNTIVSNNHFTWQRYTNGVIDSHPAIDISCTVDGQSLVITNNTAYQITGNFVNLAKTGNLIIWGEISGNSCYFRDRTGGVTSGNNYVAYSNESFPRVNVHDNAVFGNLYNSDGDESHNVGKTETNVTLTSTNCTLGASTFCTYDDESVVFSAEITPSEEISAYTVLVTGFPVPKSGYYYMTITDTTGATFPAFIDRNGLKLRLKSGTRAFFVSGFYRR